MTLAGAALGARESTRSGQVIAVHGTVLEVELRGAVPPLMTALRCKLPDGRWISAVIQAHIGGARVRAIALESARGLRRGAEVINDGLPPTVPVGRELLGRVIDLHGRALDGGPPLDGAARRPIHRPRRAPRTDVPGARSTRPGSRPSTCSVP